MRAIRSAGLLPGLLLLATACADASGPGDAGSVRVTVDSSGRWPVTSVTGEPPEWTLDSLAVIRAPDGVGFSRLSGLVLDPEGGLFVADRKEQLLYRFDDQGKVLDTLGRVGAGPGEFGGLSGIGWIDGALMVYDPGNARIMRWQRDGTPINQWTMTTRLSGDLPMFAGPGESLWLRQGDIGPSGKRQNNYIRLTASGAPDTIWYPHVEPTPPTTEAPTGSDGYVVCTEQDAFSWFYSPFTMGVARDAVTPDGRVVRSDGLRYRLALVRLPADTVAMLVRTAPPVPVTDQEWEAGLTEYHTFLREHPAAKCTGRQVRPAAKPDLRSITTDAIGRIWVERYAPTGFRWEAWQDGVLVGAFGVADTGANMRVAIARDRVAFVKYREEDGGAEIRLYRIR